MATRDGARSLERVVAFNGMLAVAMIVVAEIAGAIVTEGPERPDQYGKLADVSGEALGGVILIGMWVLPMVGAYHAVLLVTAGAMGRRAARAFAVATSPIAVAVALWVEAYNDESVGGYALTVAPALVYGGLVRLPGESVSRRAMARLGFGTLGLILALIVVLVVSAVSHS